MMEVDMRAQKHCRSPKAIAGSCSPQSKSKKNNSDPKVMSNILEKAVLLRLSLNNEESESVAVELPFNSVFFNRFNLYF